MALLSRDDIFKADDLPTKDVKVPEWGKDAEVRLRALTGAERDKLEASLVETKGKNQSLNMHNYRAKLVIASAVDDAGHPLFEAKDITKLSNKSAAALDRLAQAATELSGMSEEDVEELTGSFD